MDHRDRPLGHVPFVPTQSQPSDARSLGGPAITRSVNTGGRLNFASINIQVGFCLELSRECCEDQVNPLVLQAPGAFSFPSRRAQTL